MPDKKTKAAQALRKLGRQVQHGLTRLHRVSDQQMAKIREAVRQQWEQTHPAQDKSQTSQIASTARPKIKTKQKDKSQSHDHGHSH